MKGLSVVDQAVLVAVCILLLACVWTSPPARAGGPPVQVAPENIRCITAEVNGSPYHLLLEAAIPAGNHMARNAAFIRLAHSLEIENVNRSTPEETQRHFHARAILQAATLDQLVCDDPVSTCLVSGGFRRILIIGCASGCDGPGCQVCRVRTQE